MVKPSSEDELADRLVMAAIRLTRTLQALNKSSALSEPQISALAVVVHAGRITAKSLAGLEGVTPSAISRIVASLEQANLVTRAADPKDSRLQWISATTAGRRLIEDGHRRRLAPLARALSTLPTEERLRLAAAAAQIEAMAAALTGGDGT